MSTLRRRLPNSNRTRKIALNKAAAKLSNPGPHGVILTTPTVNRLTSINGSYNASTQAINQRKGALKTTTSDKNVVLQTLRLLVRHFIGVFNFGVERGKYNADHRIYYGIPASDGKMPDVSTEDETLEVSGNIIEGDPVRIAAGGAPMANPDVGEVSDARVALQANILDVSNAKDMLDIEQETLSSYNPEADGVLKKVWDEVETFYNEEEPASMRANARQWGVVYVSDTRITISGRVMHVVDDIAPPMPLAGATITLVETEEEATSNAEGLFELKTGITGTATIEVSAEGYVTESIERQIDNSENIDLGDIVLQPES
jgi:hypothetical protein